MAMLLSLCPCSDCPTMMKDCSGCAQFYKWLDVVIVFQGRTKGFDESEDILLTVCNSAWSVENFVWSYYQNERLNAARIWRKTAQGRDVTEVHYTGKKPFHGPASVFTIHSDEKDRLATEYYEFIALPEERKANIKWPAPARNKALSVDELLGPLGRQLKVADQPLCAMVGVRGCDETG